MYELFYLFFSKGDFNTRDSFVTDTRPIFPNYSLT